MELLSLAEEGAETNAQDRLKAWSISMKIHRLSSGGSFIEN
jgi:hypothetical protein